MRTISQVLIAALALGVHATEEQLLPLGKQQQQPTASLLPPRPGQAGQQGPPPPRAGTPATITQPTPKAQGGLLGGLLGGNNQSPAAPAPKQQGGLLGGLLGGNNQSPAQQPAPKQQGGLLGGLLGGNKPASQPAPKQSGGLFGGNKPANQPAPKQAGGLLGGGLLGGLVGPTTTPIAVKQCPAINQSRCRGRETACVPHPNAAEQYLCVKIDDDCGGRRGRACPAGQACLADPRDRGACVNGWCNNSEGICVTPPKK